MNAPIRIGAASAAAFLALMAGRVCFLVAVRVQSNIDAGEPTMLRGRYKLDGALGYSVPFSFGLVALLSLAGAILIVWPKRKRMPNLAAAGNSRRTGQSSGL